jgi:hypothetical protein
MQPAPLQDGAGAGSAFASARPGPGDRRYSGAGKGGAFVTPPASPGLVYYGGGKAGGGGTTKKTTTTKKKKAAAFNHSSSFGMNLVGVGTSGWQQQQAARRNHGIDVDPSPPPWKSSFTPPTAKLDGRAARTHTITCSLLSLDVRLSCCINVCCINVC